MEKTKIDVHSSLVIIDLRNGYETILSGYDGGYGIPLYKSKPNLIGGNPHISEKESKGPYEVAVRDIQCVIQLFEICNICVEKFHDIFALFLGSFPVF